MQIKFASLPFVLAQVQFEFACPLFDFAIMQLPIARSSFDLAPTQFVMARLLFDLAVMQFSQHVTGDVRRLEQVISNLVENAIKFTNKMGRVDVSFCVKSESDWQIVVKDTGIGIPPECLPDIFEPFRRASDYATRKHQGVGLGCLL